MTLQAKFKEVRMHRLLFLDTSRKKLSLYSWKCAQLMFTKHTLLDAKAHKKVWRTARIENGVPGAKLQPRETREFGAALYKSHCARCELYV